jgi:alpha-beta hydrolase superfamily lysophospholipase
MAARHLAETIGPDLPLVIAGYSNGAALALEYTLAVLEGEPLPAPSGLLLISPAVAVTPAAALARFNLWLSVLPGLEKLAWLSVEPEYDPFKYNSFPVHAGDQIYRLTRNIAARLDRLEKGHGISDFPPVLAFQSAVDATIPAEAFIHQFLRRLAPNNHALVLFDVNRQSETVALLADDPQPEIDALLRQPLPFDLTLVTNKSAESRRVHAVHKAAGGQRLVEEPLASSWPPGVYSLSHVAPAFPQDDPLYGSGGSDGGRLFTLGSLEPRGERNLLRVGIGDLMRLRYNPFYPYLERRILQRYFPSDMQTGSENGGG